jgi:hypothetical protein
MAPLVILCTWLAVAADPSPASAEDAAGMRQAAAGAATVRVVEVSSGRCVHLDEPQARREARAAAERALVRAVAELADELGGQRLDVAGASRELAWLVRQGGVRRDEEGTLRQADYGVVAEQVVKLALPAEVLEAWAARLQAQRQRAQRWLAGKAGGTLAGWLLGLCAFVWLDRRTGGYHRLLLALGSMGFLGSGTLAAWMLLP